LDFNVRQFCKSKTNYPEITEHGIQILALKIK